MYFIDLVQPYITNGFVTTKTLDELIIFNYTQKCTYEKAWDNITKQCRGLIYNQETKEIVARPFPKFFNIGENEETQLGNLPIEDYEVFEKYDGILGILYRHRGEYKIATRGSFDSPYAIWATNYFKKRFVDSYDIQLPDDITLLFEIIYPEGKIIIDYGDTKDLVLIGGYNFKTGKELSTNVLSTISNQWGFTLSKRYMISLSDCISNKKSLPKDSEGYVIKFVNGLRVKVKGDEYLKISRALQNLSPLHIWENIVLGKLPDSFKQKIPEELHEYMNEVEGKLLNQWHQLFWTTESIWETLNKNYIFNTKKEFAELIRTIPECKEYSSLLFKYFDTIKSNNPNLESSLDEIIKEMIKPKGNKLD